MHLFKRDTFKNTFYLCEVFHICIPVNTLKITHFIPAPSTGILTVSAEGHVVMTTDASPPAPTGKRSRAAMLQLSEAEAEELAQQEPSETLTLSERLLIESAAEKSRVSEMRIMPNDMVSRLEQHLTLL